MAGRRTRARRTLSVGMPGLPSCGNLRTDMEEYSVEFINADGLTVCQTTMYGNSAADVESRVQKGADARRCGALTTIIRKQDGYFKRELHHIAAASVVGKSC